MSNRPIRNAGPQASYHGNAEPLTGHCSLLIMYYIVSHDSHVPSKPESHVLVFLVDK